MRSAVRRTWITTAVAIVLSAASPATAALATAGPGPASPSLASPAAAVSPTAGLATAGTATTWHRYRVPVQGQANLVGVAAVSRNDAWAAGFLVKIGESAAPRPKALFCMGQDSFPSLILHWDGRTWKQVRVPNLGRVNYISASSPANVWASADCGLLHWNGHRWAQVAYTPTNAQQDSPGEVKAVGTRGAWLVGGTYDNRTQVSRGFVERWDGTSWHRVALPKLGDQFSLDGIDARSPHDVWTVGTDYSGGTAIPEPLILLHWNGRSWKRLPSPHTGMQTDRLAKVRSFGTDDVWAVGFAKVKADHDQARLPLTLHWNGHRWSSAPVPKGSGELYDVERGNGGLFAVGDTFSPASPAYAMYALRWTATGRWTTASVPAAGAGSLHALGPIPGGGVWAVGSVDTGPTIDRPVIHPVIARLG